jgi:esterase/lipase superfamily enzyme
MSSRHLLLDSPALGRRVHLWCFGHVGQPVIVFPSNAGVAHEWQQSGMVDALAPLLAGRRIKLYCPESNISQTFSGHGPLGDRMHRHHLYERFVLETLVPFVREDCRAPQARMLAAGCSMGAMYTSLFTLKHPETFKSGLCMSGRYRGSSYVRGGYHDELYYNDPLAFVPNLSGAALERVRRHTHLTLVVGQGAFEGRCLPETLELGGWLKKKHVPHHLGVWGHDARHEYTWWRKQAVHYLSQLA